MDDGLRPGVVVGGVAGVVSEEVSVEVLEEAHLPFAAERVLDGDLFEIEVAIEVHGVAHMKEHAELGVPERRIADERLVLVGDRSVPPVVACPGERAIRPDPKARRIAHGVVLHPHVRIKDVSQLIARVEGDEEIPVAERKVARHC